MLAKEEFIQRKRRLRRGGGESNESFALSGSSDDLEHANSAGLEKRQLELRAFLNRVGLGPKSNTSGYAAASAGGASGGASGSGTGLSVYQRFLNVNVESLSDYVKDPVGNIRKLKDNGHELTRKQQLLYHLSLRQKRLIRHVEEARVRSLKGYLEGKGPRQILV